MQPPRADLMLHPVRLRIIQTLIGRRLTTAEMAQGMPDVPPASLYRHLKRLVQGQIVSVVGENRVRGTSQRVYGVALDQTSVGADELRPLDRNDHMRMFTAFIAAVLDGFQRYLTQERVDLLADGVRYRQAALHLDDQEFQAVLDELDAVLTRAMDRRPRPGRRQRTFTHIIVPAPRPWTKDPSDEDGRERTG